MKNVKINESNQGFVLTLEGEKPLKPNKSRYNEALQKTIIERFEIDYKNVIENIKFESLGRKLNSRESSFLREQLTVSISQAMETWYPDNTARTVFLVNSMNMPGQKTLRYSMKEWTGKAKVVSDDDSTNMPLVARNKKNFYSPVYELQLGAAYSLNDLEAAALGTESLDSELIMDTRKGHERAFNDISFGIGDTDDPASSDIPGLFNQPTKCILAADDAALSNDNMLANTAIENRDFLVGVINAPLKYTQKNESVPDTLVMPIAQAQKIQTQALSADNSDTVARWILNNTSIRRIIASPECKSVGKNSITDALFCFNASQSSKIAEIQETLPYTPYPAQQSGLTFMVPTRSRIGGLFIFRKAIALVKNCGA